MAFLDSSRTLLALSAILMWHFPSPACAEEVLTISLYPEEAGPVIDLPRLLGTNLALWHEPAMLANPALRAHLEAWSPGLIRLPGGSWSNEYFWNGHGVRTGPETLDASAFRDSEWQIDFSDYAPGFRVHDGAGHLSDYHGAIDVLAEHQLAASLGATQMVTVNVGTGSPQLAAEWLKFTRARGFEVPYWEIGNELNGQWEVGHFLEDGSGMTGEVYAQRFRDYAAALRKVDPAVKLGGPACSDLSLAFVEELLRDAGDFVDFVSLHAYPVGGQRTEAAAKFQDIGLLRNALKRVRGWIEKYQPARSGEIEIAVTEWHMKVNEDRDTADLISGLWSAAWIGTMLEGGVTLGTQWDLLTQTATGGHSAFYHQGDTVLPKPHYWAHYLWRHHMGNRVIRHTRPASDFVEVFSTRNDRAFQVMLINQSEETASSVRIDLPSSVKLAEIGRKISFSSQEFLWDPHHHRPLHSAPPTVSALALASLPKVSLAPFSITVLELPLKGETPRAAVTPEVVGDLELCLVVPTAAPADLPVEVMVIAWDATHDVPFRGEFGPVKLSLSGPVAEKIQQIPMRRSLGRVFLQPTGAGDLQIKATAGGASFSARIALQAVALRKRVQWTFDNPIGEWGASSTFALAADPSVKPNEVVAATVMKKSLPVPNEDVLLLLDKMPEDLPRDRIGGFVGEVRISSELKTADPKAQINLVAQSEADHWMIVGSLPVEELRAGWTSFRFEVEDPRRLEAMARLYALRMVIDSKKPVTGAVYLDNIGFLLRSSE